VSARRDGVGEPDAGWVAPRPIDDRVNPALF